MRQLERIRGAGQDLIDAARADPGAEQLGHQLDRVTPRDAIADRECRDRRLQAVFHYFDEACKLLQIIAPSIERDFTRRRSCAIPA